MNLLTDADRQRLMGWYDLHKRDLPWRRTSDPYAVWVSEVMLQQTQVATVERYWLRWMERFPTVGELAQADEQEALAAWQGLGYYRRCRLLIAGAKHVHRNGVPTSAAEWLRVPGVGRYTAGAIASISQGLGAALVDGNVERVYARLTADRASGSGLTRNAWRWAEQNLHLERPGDWNQALMELGATTCIPGEPRCDSCPLQDPCLARRQDDAASYPSKPPAKQAVILDQVVWVPVCGERFGVRLIEEGRWWKGMWEFPRADASDIEELHRLLGSCERRFIGEVRHTVTHHRISLKVYRASLDWEVPALAWKTAEDLTATALPSPQRRALEAVIADGRGQLRLPD